VPLMVLPMQRYGMMIGFAFTFRSGVIATESDRE